MPSYDELDQEIDREMGWDRGEPKSSPRRKPDYWQSLLRTAVYTNPVIRSIKSGVRAVAKVVFFPIISPLGYTKRFNMQGDMVIVKRSLHWRILDGVFTRLLLTPVILAIFLIAVVYASTHPRSVRAFATPESMGIYYKRVNLVSIDNQRLSAWFIPPINADEVAFDPEGTLLQKYPAAVLCHGVGASHDQYLSLAAKLHASGFAVLLLDTRGQGESDPAAVTYGLRERMDVLAAVKFLREAPYVDPGKVCLVGRDIGATACLQAAALDSSVTAVVADGLWPKFEQRAREIFSHPSPKWVENGGGNLPTQWLAPLYTIAFEIAVRDRLSQLESDAVIRNIHTQPILFVAREGKEFASAQDVQTLATSTGGRHEVLSNLDDWEAKMTTFLVKSTGWRGPKARGADQIENLLKSRIPAKTGQK